MRIERTRREAQRSFERGIYKEEEEWEFLWKGGKRTGSLRERKDVDDALAREG